MMKNENNVILRFKFHFIKDIEKCKKELTHELLKYCDIKLIIQSCNSVNLCYRFLIQKPLRNSHEFDEAFQSLYQN